MEVLGVLADSCVISDAMTVVATFTNGYPVTQTGVSPILRLVSACDAAMTDICYASTTKITNKLMVAGPSTAIEIANPLTVTNDASHALSCSFAGGCLRTIEAKGLKTSLDNGLAEINVCGRPCIADNDISNSNESQVKCAVPSIQSLASNDLFFIDKSGPIMGEILESNPTVMQGLAFDGANLPGPTSTGSNCYMGTMFEGDATGFLTEVRFFMSYFSDIDVYNTKLMFQGSNDGFANPLDITTIFTVGEELHEGRNYYKFQEMVDAMTISELPAYRYYRLFNAENNGCDNIGELTFIGSVAFETETNIHSCSVVISIDSVEETLTSQVSYDAQTTPFLTAISPRWGSVEGDTDVTFTGVNFSTTAADYTVTLDGETCTVDPASLTSTSMTCNTDPRYGAYLDDPELIIFIENVGNVATQGFEYRYVSLWS